MGVHVKAKKNKFRLPRGMTSFVVHAERLTDPVGCLEPDRGVPETPPEGHLLQRGLGARALMADLVRGLADAADRAAVAVKLKERVLTSNY